MNRSLPARGLLRTINLYQRLTARRPSPCRYIPTCSEYAREALEEHGAARGTWLTGRRLARCHPLSGFGFDPVPPRAPNTEVGASGTELGLG
ncbi:MAG: membrane protein insertion efficiency factor YidD [Acidimicrobiia bacterium]